MSLNDPIDTDKDGNTLTLLDTIATDDHILEDIDLRMKVRQLYDAVKTRLSPRASARSFCCATGLRASGRSCREIAKKAEHFPQLCLAP